MKIGPILKDLDAMVLGIKERLIDAGCSDNVSTGLIVGGVFRLFDIDSPPVLEAIEYNLYTVDQNILESYGITIDKVKHEMKLKKAREMAKERLKKKKSENENGK